MKEVLLTSIVTLLIFIILCNVNININDKNIQILIVIGVSILIYVLLHYIPQKENFSPYDKQRSLLVMANDAERLLTSEEDTELDFDSTLLSADYINQIKKDTSNQLKYGDVIYLQCNSLNDRFLTGGRGSNIIRISGSNNNDNRVEDIETISDDIEPPISDYQILKFIPTGKIIKYDSRFSVSDFIDLENMLEIKNVNTNFKTIKFVKKNKYISLSSNGSISFSNSVNNNCKFVFVKRGLGVLIRQYSTTRYLYLNNNNLANILINSSMDVNLDDYLFEERKIYFGTLNRLDNVVLKTYQQYFVGVTTNFLERKNNSSSDCKFNIISKGNHIFYLKNNDSNKFIGINPTGGIILDKNLTSNKEFYLIRQINSKFIIKSVERNSYLVVSENGRIATSTDISIKNYFNIIEAVSNIVSNLDTQTDLIIKENLDNKQQVFSTSGSGPKYQWIVRSILGNGKLNYPDPLHGQKVRYSSKIYLQSTTRENRYLSSGLPGSYSNLSVRSHDVIGVFPLEYENFQYGDENEKINMEWTFRKDNKNTSIDINNENEIVSYNLPITIQSLHLNNRFLTGGLGGKIDKAHNQEVYVLSNQFGRLEQEWIIRRERGDGDVMRVEKIWPVSKFTSGKIGHLFWKNKFMASSCRGYSPTVNNIKLEEGSSSSDKKFGEPCNSANDKFDYESRNGSVNSEDEPIGIDSAWKVVSTESGWATKNPNCLAPDNTYDFLTIDLGEEKYIQKGKMLSGDAGFVTKFNLKVAGEDGILVDVGEYNTNLNLSWLFNNNLVFIEDGFSKILTVDNINYKTCEDLGWSPVGNDNSFCATTFKKLGSNNTNRCYHRNRNNYNFAKRKCNSIGARLCNLNELRDFRNEINETRSDEFTTCGSFRNKYIWSSQKCTMTDGTIGNKALKENLDGSHEDKCFRSNSRLNITCCTNFNGSVQTIISNTGKPANNVLPSNRINERFVIKTEDNTEKISIKLFSSDNYLYAKNDYETIGIAPLSEIQNNEHKFTVKKINGSNKVAIKTYLNTYLSIGVLIGRYPKKILKQKELNNISLSNTRELFLFHNINPVNNDGFLFNVNRKLRFLKITPMGSYGLCNMKLELYDDDTNVDLLKKFKDQNINIKASSCFKFRDGELTEDKLNGQYCRYGGYNTDKLNRFSDGGWMMSDKDVEGSAFIVYDNLREGFINGGIMYTRNDYNDDSCSSCNNYVKKFKVQIAGNNKIFRDIGEHITNFNITKGKDIGFKFDIMKNNVRYVKIILLACNNKCSMRLDLF